MMCGAIARYYDAGLKINIEWIEEYNELVEYNAETKEQFQVQVIVTRHEEDFLEFLQTEEMSAYGS